MFGRLKGWWLVPICYNRCPKLFLPAIGLAALLIYWV